VVENFALVKDLQDAGEAFKAYVEVHHDWLPALVFALFTSMNSIRIFAYLPQILCVVRDGNGASAISYGTWVLFLLSHLTTIAYAMIYVGDPIMALIFCGNAVACFVILVVTFIKRRAHAARPAVDRL
jgi:predicted lysophospholipase L1 biosynthesis ABC-type transport system permease subunit